MDMRELVIASAKGGPCNKRLLAFLCDEAPAEALAKAQRSSDWLERAAIAMHANTPPAVVARSASRVPSGASGSLQTTSRESPESLSASGSQNHAPPSARYLNR